MNRGLGPLLGLVLLVPALGVVWTEPAFVTQDGPAHLYNAHILRQSLVGTGSPFSSVFEVHWEPLPNWAGHLVLMGLLSVATAEAADRLATSLTLVGFAASVIWLRWRVCGGQGITLASILAVLLALNVAWLFGFTSFLLGSCLFAITLGVWWGGRDRMGPRRALALGGLLVLGYFAHLVSLGLTVIGLMVLAATTPGPHRSRRSRACWTVASLLPLVPLALVYRSLMRDAGPLEPTWGHLADPFSLAAWATQLTWADPISLASKQYLPFTAEPRPAFTWLAPVVWMAIGLTLLVGDTLRRHRHDDAGRGRRGWAVLALLLGAGGLLGPDSLGPDHGHYLSQRLVLLGLVALVPWLAADPRALTGRLAGGALLAALTVQTALVWDYARLCERRAGAIRDARPFVGTGQRIGTLLIDIRSPFRANPLLHADNLLGLGTGNVVWNNYEAAHYYFPVRFRRDRDRPPIREFEAIALLDGPGESEARRARWGRLLAAHRERFDVLLVWGAEPGLDALNARWFEPVFQERNVRVLRRRSDAPASGDDRLSASAL